MDDPTTNAGRGSDLREDEHVESDSSIKDGVSRAFGALGAILATMYVLFFLFPHCSVLSGIVCFQIKILLVVHVFPILFTKGARK